MDALSVLLLGSGTATDAPSTSAASIVLSISASDAQACVARGEALIMATGYSWSSPLPTTQSSAFFETLGTPWAYPELQISAPMDAASRDRRCATAGGAARPPSG
jgi:hypothetical protein